MHSLARTWRRFFPCVPAAPPSPAPLLAPAAALTLIAAALFFSRLGCPLLEPEEARYAEIPRQMLNEGRVVEPVWHGEPYYHKPPLLYWLVMLSYTLFGVHDWAARLVPALAGVGTVLVTYLWGRRAVGPRAGFVAALLLCLTPRFVYFGRMLLMDGLLCLWVTTALAAAHLVVSGRLSRRWWVVSAVACGLGVLTKGPVTGVLVFGPLVAYQLLERRAWRSTWRWYLLYQAVVLTVAGPWYGAVALRRFREMVTFFWEHNVCRFVAPVDHAEPPWFFVPDLLLGTLPWALLLLPLGGLLASRSLAAARRRPPELGFFLLAFLGCLVFFSISRCKRAAYILPALPPLALALGTVLADRFTRGGTASWPRLARAATTLVLLLGAGVCAAAGVSGLWPTVAGLAAAGVVAVGLAVFLGWGRRLTAGPAWGVCAAATFALLLVGIHQLLPDYHRRFAHRGQVRPQLAAAGGLPVICYPRRWDSVTYYLQRQDVRSFGRGEHAAMVRALEANGRTMVFVKGGRHLEEFVRSLPPTLEFVPRGRRGPVVVPGVIERREPPAEPVPAGG